MKNKAECCANCEHCRRAKGSFLGSVDYWCSITYGQKSANHYCYLYRKEEV